MNLRLPKSVLLPLAAGLVQILSGCLSSTSTDPDKTSGGSDEIDTRLAVDRSGHPIGGARIALVKAGDSTGKVVAVNATADDGSYPEFRVPDGFYSVLVRDDADSIGKFVDSLEIESHKAPKGRDTLLSLGSVRGVVRVAQGHSPATVTVGMLGTDIVANVKPDGTFRIELVPGGLYTLAAIPSLEGYVALYKRIQLKDGQNLLLSDTLVMPMTGLPVPGGLAVVEDSATGNIQLSWNRVDHPDLLGYVLDRVEGGLVVSSRYLTDTTWIDSLSGYWEGQSLLGPWPSRELAYRVRSRSLSGLPDSRNAASTFLAKPPIWTRSMIVPEPKLSQDSISGNVHLSWTVVRHPCLKGYVVERIVGGVIVASSILHDTAYIDSLGRHWDGLPLSGPWPDLDVRYRIAAIAKDTARGTASVLRCHAPKWMSLLDSIRIAVTQDSLTGNVRIHWNPSKHRHLAGYKVERLENGAQWSGRTLIDTNYVDSVGGYWATLPLLGPWPTREFSYRIRLVADSAGTDGWTASFAFQAKPPEWTKHVDSVKATVMTDTVTGARILRWNAPLHPDLSGWTVTRTVNGVQDCSTPMAAGEWRDSECPDPVSKAVDSGLGMRTGAWTRVLQYHSAAINYRLSTVRRLGMSEQIASLGRRDSVSPVVEWRDSLLAPGKSSRRIWNAGGWLVMDYNSYKNDVWISKDGQAWEQVPETERTLFAGSGDSLWTARKVDGATWSLKSRTGPGQWSERRIPIPAGDACTGIQIGQLNGLFVDSGSPVFECYMSQEYWKWTNSGLVQYFGMPTPDERPYSNALSGFFPLSDGTSYAMVNEDFSSIGIYRRGPAEHRYSLVADQASIYRFLLSGVGAFSNGDILFENGAELEVRNAAGHTAYVPFPEGFNLPTYSVPVSGGINLPIHYEPYWIGQRGADRPNRVIVWNDEIWFVWSSDQGGHVSKGKLNLPK